MAAISKIRIDGFKAFPKKFELNLNGRNLLMYGENGSGKSSIYYALHALLQSQYHDKGAIYFDKNAPESIVNKDTATVEPYIEIELEGSDTKYRLSQNGYEEIPHQAISPLRDMNAECVFINHKFLFRAFSFRNSEYIDLFPIFIKDILPFVLTQDDAEYIGTIYDDVMKGIRRHGKSNQLEDSYKKRIERFNLEVRHVINKINSIVSEIYNKNFRNKNERSLKIVLEYDDNHDKIPLSNKSYWLRCDYRYQLVNKAGNWEPKQISSGYEILQPSIMLRVEEEANGTYQPIEKPQTYFNEARLTAIALSVRFSLLDTIAAANGRFIALDDMLISLDMSNRAKVVAFLLSISEKYKIYLFTHGKMFFEYFKHKTRYSKQEWVYKEIYLDDSRAPYLKNNNDYLGQAEHFIKQHEYEIAGNFLRKAAEAICKRFLPRKWQLSPDYTLLDLNGLIQNCKKFASESGVKDLSVFDKLDEYRKFILNPSSHDSYDVVKYRYEVENCLETLRSFDSIEVKPFMEYGAKVYFELKEPLPSINVYKFEISLCDDFRVIKQDGQELIISKGMINYRVIKNGVIGDRKTDNTTLKHFYDVNYKRSDKSGKSNFLEGIFDAKSNKSINMML